MQVDGIDSCSDSDTEAEDIFMMQLDGAIGNSDSESIGTGMGLGDNDSEFSIEEQNIKSICLLCKEDIKFSRTYHFAAAHFSPRLAKNFAITEAFHLP